MPRQSKKTLGELARENLRNAVAQAKANRGQPRQKEQGKIRVPGLSYDKAVGLDQVLADFFNPANLHDKPAFQRGMVLSLVPRYLPGITGVADVAQRLADVKIQGADRLIIRFKPGSEILKQEMMWHRETLRSRINQKMQTEIIKTIIIQ